MKLAISHLILGLITLSLSACVTAPRPKRMGKKPRPALPENKAGSKDKAGATDRLSQSPEDSGLNRQTVTTSAGEFFLKHSQPTTAFTTEDENTLAEMPGNAPQGSIEEAALVVGIVKLSIKEAKKEPSFQETELYNQDDADVADETVTDRVSLEALALEKQLDLPAALTHNNLLKNFVIYQQVVHALRSTNNSPEFITRVKDVIDHQARQWTGEGAQALYDSTQELPSTTGPESTAARNTVADVRSGDSLLMEAQSLAAGRRFRDAITKASQVPNQSPLFETAQEKIIMFSTEAVQELRSKAAQAFQNAIPVGDAKARAAYLEQAKEHLEDALKNYPQAPADQLSTVRENLAVITRDLERLDVDSADENGEEY